LHGLFFGINEYKSTTYDNIRGALSNVNNMVDYFHRDLGVPLEQLTVRRNSDVTRSAIINDIRASGNNPLIKEQDPIVIYFSGHGCVPTRPKDWPVIQAIVAHDSNTLDSDGGVIGVIPSYTIDVLLVQLAEMKGNNITLILDCGHSGSETRVEPRGQLIRGLGKKGILTPTESLGSGILATGSAAINGRVQVMPVTHVILAACAPHERVTGTKDGGHFTTALLNTLRQLGASNLTYKDCIQELRLPENIKQNPQCVGYHVNRRLFEPNTSAFSRTFIGITPEKAYYVLNAGAAHGITVGSIFQIYPSNSSEIGVNPALGTARVTSTTFGTSYLQLEVSSPDVLALPSARYALQIGAGSEDALRIYCTEPLSKRFEDSVEWREAFSSTEGGGLTLVHSTEDTAQIIIDLNEAGRVTFRTGNHLVIKLGHSLLPYTVPAVINEVLPVLRAAAKWAWHVTRTSNIPSKEDPVMIEFLQVQDDTNAGNYQVVEDSWNKDGIVRLDCKEGHSFAFKLVNLTEVVIYPYLFYFDVLEQSIGEHTVGRASSLCIDSFISQCRSTSHQWFSGKRAMSHPRTRRPTRGLATTPMGGNRSHTQEKWGKN
ncbi:hypothetical protein BDV93DRAFT_461243, partial [Ceratobasidium sp. AG-I]